MSGQHNTHEGWSTIPPRPTQTPPRPTQTPFGAAVRRLRTTARLSQSKLAEAAGFNHSYVSRLESGERPPTRDAAEALSRALELVEGEHVYLLMAGGFLPDARDGGPLRDVLEERERQTRRWGVQHLSWAEWFSILQEEVGEAAQAANGAMFTSTLDLDRPRHIREMREELVQVAAVALQIIEAIDTMATDSEVAA